MKRQQGLSFQMILICGLAFLLFAEFDQAYTISCRNMLRSYPDIQWIELKKGQRLLSDDAIVTCEVSSVTIKSNWLFTDLVKWDRKMDAIGEHLGEILPETMVVITDPSGQTKSFVIEIEITEVEGKAYYAAGFYQKHKVLGEKILSQEEEEKEKQAKEDLKAIGWEPLTMDHILGPWDMIWTQEDGRVEIEVLEGSYRSESIDVKNSKGRLTRKKRLPPDSYFILGPHSVLRAKVNKIIGKVWVATDREKVREYWEKYRSNLGGGPMLADPKWKEVLKKEELE